MVLFSVYLRIILLLFSTVLVCDAHTSYRNFQLLRLQIDPENIYHKHVIDILMHHQPEIDIWSQPTWGDPSADVVVSPSLADSIKRLLRRNELPYVVIHKDIQKLIDGEKDQSHSRRNRRSVRDRNTMNIRKYNSYQKIEDYLRRIARNNPNIVSLMNLNSTFEGRNLIGVKVGSQKFMEIGTPGQNKPAVWIDGGMHAREWIAPAALLYAIEQMVSLFGRDREIDTLLTKYDWWILPVLNADGYEFSRSHDRLWRKTRSVDSTSRRRHCIGVDANRNWGHHWGEAGADLYNQCSNIYAGTEPFSEIEVKSMKRMISNIPHLQLYLSLHSYGQIWLSPWGYSTAKPPNYDSQQLVAEEALAAIENLSGKQYSFGAIADLMYPASGTSIDYMQSVGVPYSFAVELSPTDEDNNYGFFYPAQFIAPTGEELLAALKAITKHLTFIASRN